MNFLLLDADGVLLKKVEYFSARFAREQAIPEETVTAFFRNEFKLCQEGKADLRNEIEKYLQEWKWVGSVDHLLEHWFSSDVNVNLELGPDIMTLRKNGVRCYLVSNQEKYRADYVRKEFAPHSLLDGYFFSYELHYRKSHPEFFSAVLREIAAQPGDVVYIDNNQASVDAAKTLGIQGFLYDDTVMKKLVGRA